MQWELVLKPEYDFKGVEGAVMPARPFHREVYILMSLSLCTCVCVCLYACVYVCVFCVYRLPLPPVVTQTNH